MSPARATSTQQLVGEASVPKRAGLPRRVDLLGAELEAERRAAGLPDAEERQMMMPGAAPKK